MFCTCSLVVAGKTRTKDKYRVVYSDHQRVELEKEFYYSRYITIRRKAELASNLGLSERQVKIWFQNRRAKERKQVKKRDEFVQKDAPNAVGIQLHPQQQTIIHSAQTQHQHQLPQGSVLHAGSLIWHGRIECPYDDNVDTWKTSSSEGVFRLWSLAALCTQSTRLAPGDEEPLFHFI